MLPPEILPICESGRPAQSGGNSTASLLRCRTSILLHLPAVGLKAIEIAKCSDGTNGINGIFRPAISLQDCSVHTACESLSTFWSSNEQILQTTIMSMYLYGKLWSLVTLLLRILMETKHLTDAHSRGPRQVQKYAGQVGSSMRGIGIDAVFKCLQVCQPSSTPRSGSPDCYLLWGSPPLQWHTVLHCMALRDFCPAFPSGL